MIVGRPNVGKSSLLNRLVGRRVSIVEPTAGVTRDRVSAELSWDGRRFELTDTGGLGLVDEEQLKAHIEMQIDAAIGGGDLVLFVVDGKEGIVPGDEMVARRLRRLDKPVLLVANKVESRWDEFALHEWLRLGFGDPHPVSAIEGTGISDLKDLVAARLPAEDDDEQPGDDDPADDVLRFAVVGKRNSGKSTLINALAGEQRVIVSEIPGTTRDAVDVVFEYDGHRAIAIDTAGVRKKRSIQDAIEFYSYSRATASIRRADVVLLLFDITEPISQVDKKIADYCVEHHKPVLICGNKIDLADELQIGNWDDYVRQQLPGLGFAPIAFVSAAEGENLAATLGVLRELRDQTRIQLPTAELNAVLQRARERLAPKGPGKIPKLFYATQIGTQPLSVLVFVNEPKLFTGQYERYLKNRLREAFECEEVPLRLVFRRREKVELPPQ